MKNLITLVFAALLLAAPLTETTAQKSMDYQTAIGLRAGWGVSLTGKHFINDNHAIEGILNYRSFGGFGVSWGWMRISGLYLVHQPLDDVIDGLGWYYGGGAYVGFWTGDFDFGVRSDRNSTFIGISGALGLDYTFADVPLNVSVDWIPSFRLTGGGTGFTGEVGGLAVRYILR